MITRQNAYDALFTLKNSGVDEANKYITLLSTCNDIPKEVINFLRNNSPIFQFFRYLQKHQRALMKSILDYEKLSNEGKIKALSSFITRVMIAVEYESIPKSFIDLLDVSDASKAIYLAFSEQDYSMVDSMLNKLNSSMKLFISNQVGENK